MKKFLIHFPAYILIIFSLSCRLVFATATSYGTTTVLPIDANSIHDGDIVSSSKGGYTLSNQAYDPTIIGVVSFSPAVLLSNTADTSEKPVVAYGKAYVRVSTTNGAIAAGDFITSSAITGVGQKSTEPGFILGVAEQDYSASDPNKIGRVLVNVYPHFGEVSTNFTINLVNSLRLAFSSAFITPLGSLRYFIAGFIVLVSFVLGFSFFGRASSHGIEALGRNPLAGRNIVIGILMNVFLTISIMAFGVAMGYLILVL